MSARLTWKVCGLKEPQNMREVAQLQPDYVGMIFYPKSPRFADEQVLSEVLKDLSVRKVGVFVNESAEAMLQVATTLKLDVLQLHGNESVETASACKKEGLEVWKAFAISEGMDWEKVSAFESVCDQFLFDTPVAGYGGSGKHFNWALLDQYAGSVPFLLSGGLSEEDVEQVRKLTHPKLAGIDVNSRMEDAPGLKNVNRLRELAKRLNDD